MGITYVGGQTGLRAGSTSTSAVTFALTGGSDTTPQAGDLVLIGIAVGSAGRNPACAVSTPAGYTALGLLNASTATQDTSMDVSRKFMGGTPDTTFTLPSTGNTQDAQAYVVHVFRGVNTSTTLDVAVTSATGTGTDRPNPPSITPVTAGAYVVIFGAGGSATGLAYTAPANYTTNFKTSTSPDTNDVTIGGGYRAWTSGAEDPAAFTGGENGASDSWVAYTIALRPTPDPVAGDDSADEGSWQMGGGINRNFIAAAALTTALVTSVAVRAGNEAANAWQDELPPPPTGTTGGLSHDLWKMSTGQPRLIHFYADEVIVPQPVPLRGDEGVEVYRYTVKKAPVLPPPDWTDERVAQPAVAPLDYGEWTPLSVPPPKAIDRFEYQDELGTIAPTIVEESEWTPPIVVVTRPSIALHDTQDSLGAQPTVSYGSTGGAQPDLWKMSTGQPRITHFYADDVIVPQPAPFIADEGEWAPFVARPVISLYVADTQDEVHVTADEEVSGVSYVAPKVVFLAVADTQDELGTPAAALAIDAGEWVAPFSVTSAKWLGIAETQDEKGQPAANLVEHEFWIAPYVARQNLSLYIADTQDELGYPFTQGTTGGFPPDLWRMSTGNPRIVQFFADDAIVVQPIPIGMEDGYWPEMYSVKAPIWTKVEDQQDERPLPPLPLSIDDSDPAPSHTFSKEVDVWIPAPWQYGLSDGIAWAPIDEDYQITTDWISKPLGRQFESVEELWVPPPAPLRIDEGEWTPPFVAVPVKSLYIADQQDERPQPAAPLSVDDSDSFALPLAIKEGNVWGPVPWQYGLGEYAVFSPIDEDYQAGTEFWVKKTPVYPAEWATDERPQLPASAVDELYQVAEFAVKAKVQVTPEVGDNELVPPPAPLSIDEGEWTPPFSVPAAKSLVVEQTQDERGIPLAFDEGTWEPPFVRAPFRWIQDFSDEATQFVAPTSIRVDEYFPMPWLLTPAKKVVVIPQMFADPAESVKFYKKYKKLGVTGTASALDVGGTASQLSVTGQPKSRKVEE